MFTIYGPGSHLGTQNISTNFIPISHGGSIGLVFFEEKKFENVESE